MSNGQAKKGGEMGMNGEFYKGGQFLPSTTEEKGRYKVKKYTGPKKVQTAPYLWLEVPKGLELADNERISGFINRFPAHWDFEKKEWYFSLNTDYAILAMNKQGQTEKELKDIFDFFNNAWIAGKRFTIIEYGVGTILRFV